MSKGMRTEKKSVYVVTAWLKEEDEEGNPLNWSSPSETYYADTYEQAQQLKEKLMSGLDEYYGDLVEDCWISDEKKEIEFMVPVETRRLFVDMDGTLAVFKPVDEMETLYEKGYFLDLEPHENVVAAIKEIITKNPDIEVNILSAYLSDSKYALQEKNAWLDKYLPEISRDHRIFVPCGTDKKEGIRDGIREDDFLLDDYTKNLNEWQPPARGIKLLNGINHNRGTWAYDRLRYDREAASLASAIVSVVRGEQQILDNKEHSAKVSQQTTKGKREEIAEVKENMEGNYKEDYELSQLKAKFGRYSMEVLKYQAAAFDSLNNRKVGEPVTNTFTIYQVKEDAPIEYRSPTYMDENGLTVDAKNYDKVYTAPLMPGVTLDQIAAKFQIDHPGFKRYLGAADIIVLHRDGKDAAYFISDIAGFSDVTKEFQSVVEQNPRVSVLNNLHKKQEQIKATELVKEEKSVEGHGYEKFERGGER